ncbi:MAG TPA: ribonucleotide-diphosphate reductase subunit alpha, partial [bacterium]|nr:ribonucleotide-diphosphate reductase subunit alpha [bacterium]
MSKIFHKEQLAKAVNPKFAEMVFKDSKIKPKFSENALTILRKRYLQSGETPEGMLERVSMGNPDWYNMMARLDFLPNSPTLFNLGTGKGTSSACFVFDIEDSMDHIMHVATKIASVQKWGGGVGMNFSKLRPKGAEVKGTGNHAGGPVAFLKMYNAIGDCITQSGKRNAAQMAILNVYHADIEEWITCKQEDPDSLSTFNMSVSIPDDFMEDVISNRFKTELFDKIVEAAWKTGDPGVYFVDRAERDNPTPHLGKLVGPNPCGEVPNRDNEPCNLGSINLANFVIKEKWYAFDAPRLRETIRMAVR